LGFARPNPASPAKEVGAARSNWGMDTPRQPSAPTRRKSRRDVPSQSRLDVPLTENMNHTSAVNDNRACVKAHTLSRAARKTYFFTGKCRSNHCTISSFI
jgi:hypothetical protein